MNARLNPDDKHRDQPASPCQSDKLTKRFLMSLQAGLYLVSNCCDGFTRETAVPVFAEVVTPLEDRTAQWERIKAAYANGRLCDVFESREHYEEWWSHWHSSPSQ